MRGQAPGGRRPPATVVVGLSSGVDSSVAAWLLKEQGCSVIAVTIALADPGDVDGPRSCCSPDLMAKAKSVADHLGIPHYAVDKRGEFQSLVVDYFISEYSGGRTPNPCSKCNSRLRFRVLADVADRLGAEFIATGHYASLRHEPQRLCRAMDQTKDQSYVLAEVDPLLIERCVFPLGAHLKTEVREIAAHAGLGGLVSRESQDICFVPGNRYREFLTKRLGERPGVVVDEVGRVIGRHTGTYNYTIGQRKGLGPGGGPPLYVTKVEPERQRVVATPEGGDATKVIHFDVVALHREPPSGPLKVQFRSVGQPAIGELHGATTVVLNVPARGVAPGQTLALYDADEVVLGGVIRSTSS